MKILFSLAVLSFAALLWAALAIVRHVRKTSALAASSASDADITEALDMRLSELARQPPADRVPAASTGSQQDFAYFNRDAPASILANKPFPDATVKPAVADRT